MISDIDRICPVQFIEGRNKFAEYGKTLDVDRGIYVEYIPKVSHCIYRLDMFLEWAGLIIRPQDNRLVIYADYLDHPTDIVLTEGNMRFDMGEAPSQGWRTVEMNYPVVLIAHKRYWLSFVDPETEFKYCVAAKGDEIITKLKDGEKWETKDELLMIRFYGRILPLALVH